MPPVAPGANSELLLSSLDWLSQQDSLIDIPARPPRALSLRLGDWGARWNFAIALTLPVLAILGVGLLVRARRRRRI